jgi:hypothetical protein
LLELSVRNPKVVCVVEGGCPSIYTWSKGGASAILGAKPWAAPPLHEGMPPPIEGVVEQRVTPQVLATG